ncbi:MAG: acetoin utilization protein AcuC [Aquificaceae bacterium]|nr:acetoin utilization protein AcuC [Aquificaceae bacterium]MCX8060147.1 acetoin utilization protein AcuC [Aquificaceae bacterium]MDW8097308.1 acetoin utilization protein AcuC [Aquificaceae bacterium]
MRRQAKLIGSFKYKSLRYAPNHPLRIPRVSLLLELLQSLGLVEDRERVESREALWEELLLFHTEEYLRALRECESKGRLSREQRELFNLGNYENPISPATWRGSLLATGSSLQAVELFQAGYVPFNPAGGMHHAYPSKANGFCFINDPGIALQELLRRGYRRVLYIDLDAHHCDGVQDFFYEEDRVFVLSLHQSPEYAFPFRRGYLQERGEGRGKGYNLNLPLPPGVGDREFLYVLEKTLPLVAELYRPQVYVLQLGTDTLREDYLSKFELSNEGLLRAFDLVREVLGEGIYLGGGGYHPVALARAWSLLWCRLSGREVPKSLNPEAKKLLLSVDFEEFDEEVDRGYLYERLLDPLREGDLRPEVKKVVQEALSYYL